MIRLPSPGTKRLCRHRTIDDSARYRTYTGKTTYAHVDMMDVEYKHGGSDHHDRIDLAHEDRDEDEDGNENIGGRPTGDVASEEDVGGIANDIGGLPRGFAGLDESAAMAIFADYR